MQRGPNVTGNCRTGSTGRTRKQLVPSAEVRAEGRDDPAGREAEDGGEEEKPEDDADVWSALSAEKSAIMTDFARKLAGAPKNAKRHIKDERKAAMARASDRARKEVSSRRSRRKEKKLRHPDRGHKSRGGAATP